MTPAEICDHLIKRQREYNERARFQETAFAEGAREYWQLKASGLSDIAWDLIGEDSEQWHRFMNVAKEFPQKAS